jgi:subtilase family serine protease
MIISKCASRTGRSVLLAGSVLGLTQLGLTAAAYAAPVVTGAIDDNLTTTLAGDLSASVRHATDAGPLSEAALLPHIRLELKRPAALQAALDQVVHDQRVKGSAHYRQWLKPASLRAYGPDQADIDKVTSWLSSHGLTVNSVSPSGMEVDFGGNAGSVARAFQTSLHNMTLNGENHVANVTAPVIPTALTSVVTGVTLHNFFPKPQLTKVTPQFTSTGPYGTFYGVAPADFDTIYNVNPLLTGANQFRTPITGAGVTIAVVEQTMIQPSDWNTFRSSFGLSGYAGTFTQIHPGGCTNPHFTGDEVEAAIDAEWASAPAPDANIIEASCATEAPLNFGVEQALQNLVEDGTTATIFSISYGGPELAQGFSFEQGWTNLVEEGAAEGIAIFVSTGDSGSSFDRDAIDVDGVGVNGLSDSAYVVAVGGTDFLDTSEGLDAQYWHAKNTKTGYSAKSYIPEEPWNNSCASSIIAKFTGYSDIYQSCNENPTAGQPGVGGTGGQSVYYAKPDWQLTNIPGMPNDGSRDQPDVSLFAANGIWGHFYLICMSDPNEGGSPCHYNVQGDLLGNAYGGTSVSAPAMAGIAALIQQGGTFYGATGGLGNPAPILYTIAQAQFANPLALKPCDSSLGNAISKVCAFNIVTAGNNAEPCYAGTPNCTVPASSTNGIGVLTNKAAGPGPAYHADLGYSLATGLGTVNATNLLYNYIDTE